MAVQHELAPVSAIPIAYFATAHAAFASALVALAIWPDLPAGVFYQPKVVALVHLVTIGWLTGSILGAFYIVGPLALGIPMRASRTDWVMFVLFAAGALGMVSHFWIASYSGMAWSAGLVVEAVAFVAVRAWRGRSSRLLTPAIRLHLVFALVNFLAAATFGMLIGIDRFRGTLGIASLPSIYVHAHLAAVGWVMMMVMGLSYRLIPMMLPAAIPKGRLPMLSAVLVESGLVLLFFSIEHVVLMPAAAIAIAAGIISFITQIARVARTRKPRPPALPSRDWSTWQTHAAIIWLVIAMGLGLALAIGGYGAWRTAGVWVYGVAGLVGFLAQMVSGVQGRIVPMYAWYHAGAASGGAPAVAANALPSASMARFVFLGWALGVPLLAAGLAFNVTPIIRAGSIALLAGLIAGGAHGWSMLRRAKA